jgi:hypothetical protein
MINLPVGFGLLMHSINLIPIIDFADRNRRMENVLRGVCRGANPYQRRVDPARGHGSYPGTATKIGSATWLRIAERPELANLCTIENNVYHCYHNPREPSCPLVLSNDTAEYYQIHVDVANEFIADVLVGRAFGLTAYEVVPPLLRTEFDAAAQRVAKRAQKLFAVMFAYRLFEHDEAMDELRQISFGTCPIAFECALNAVDGALRHLRNALR